MGRRTLLLIASMLVAALATGLVYIYVSGADTRAETKQTLLDTLVASKEIPAGTSLDELPNFTIAVKFRVEEQPPGAVANIDGLKLKVGYVKNTIAQGLPILPSQFTQDAPSVAKTDRLALTITLGDPNRLAPLLGVGDKVAIFLIAKNSRCSVPSTFPDVTLLEPTVTIAAIDARQLTDAELKAQKLPAGKSSSLITLDVAPLQAQRILSAQRAGELYFTLLGPTARVAPGTVYCGSYIEAQP